MKNEKVLFYFITGKPINGTSLQELTLKEELHSLVCTSVTASSRRLQQPVTLANFNIKKSFCLFFHPPLEMAAIECIKILCAIPIAREIGRIDGGW